MSRSSGSTPAPASRLGLLAMATVGEGGWVDLLEPIIMRGGEAFIAVPVADRAGWKDANPIWQAVVSIE